MPDAFPISDLVKKKCKPCEGGMKPLGPKEAEQFLKQIPGWSQANEGITKTFQFKNYDETSAFVNAVIWMARREDHHPEISFGYKTCRVTYSTHSIKGLSENDFICAAKVEELF